MFAPTKMGLVTGLELVVAVHIHQNNDMKPLTAVRFWTSREGRQFWSHDYYYT